MRGTIGKLFAAAVLLVALSVTCLYVGNRKAAAHAPPPAENDFTRQFAADPGDGWMLSGGFLMIVALAVASAGGMIWIRERD